MLQQHAVNPLPQISKQQVQNTLSKPIIRPWEEIIYKKNITRLGYDKEVTFHIPDYSRPIKFQSAGFLQESSYLHASFQENILKSQHCHQVGHMEDQCFDLHPCEYCGKHKMQEICKNKEPLWVDDFLVMTINSQEYISFILQNSLSSIDASCSKFFFILSHYT